MPKEDKKCRSQQYRPEWEKEDWAQGWLSRSKFDASKAFCTWCKKQLTPGKSELMKHVQTTVHKKTSKTLVKHLRDKKYRSQQYRPEWEKEDWAQGWLSRSKLDLSKAFCTWCKKQLTPGKSELMKHVQTTVHKQTSETLIKHLRVKKYRSQQYRPEWEKEDWAQGWLSRSKLDVSKAFCKWCKKQLTPGKSELMKHIQTTVHKQTSKSFVKHLRVKHPATYKEAEAQKEEEMELSYGMVKLRQSMNKSLLKMITVDLLPGSVVEGTGFREFVRCLDSRFELPTKKSIMKTMLPELAEEVKNKIKLEVVIASYFALTVETWNYCETQNYLTLTAHFIKDSWEMSSIVLETFDHTEENTGEHIALNLKRITDEWTLSERIISLVSNNLDTNVTSATLSTGWEHLSCFGQMLNSVVLTALKSVAEISRIQKKTSKAIDYFEKSIKAADTLATVQQQHNLPVHKLKQEVASRWNSIFYMMEGIVEQFEAVNTVLCFLGKDQMCLCDDEVELIRNVIEVLRPFEAATKELCTEPYTAMSKVIPIATLLQQVTASTGTMTPGPQSALKSALLHQMTQQFANLESNYTLAVATLLDPRFKRHAFTDATAMETAQHRLLSEIISTVSAMDADSNTNPNFNNDSATVSFWNIFYRKVSEAGAQKTTSSEADNESRRYFKEANIPHNSNPLQWWRLNQVQFPHLKVLAQKYLCIPATSVSSQQLFTQKCEVIDQRRNMIKPSNLHTMMFLSTNL